MRLQSCRQILLEETKENFGLIAAGYKVRELEKTFYALESQLTALAICHLMIDGNSQKYFENLQRSAQCRAYFLCRGKKDGTPNLKFLGRGYNEAFFSSLVAGNIQETINLVKAWDTPFNKDHEYPDDYYYSTILFSLLENNETMAQTSLSELEHVLNGEETCRHAICKALLTKNKEAFDDAFEHFLNDWDIYWSSRRDKAVSSDSNSAIIHIKNNVSVEALALLRLAELRVSYPVKAYPFCPDGAYLPVNQQSINNAFTEIDSLLPKF